MALANPISFIIAACICAILAAAIEAAGQSSSAPASAPSGITIERLAPATGPADAPQLPLAADGDDLWLSGKPAWEGKSKGIAAKIWIAATEKAFLFRVVVNDDKHENPYHERNLWRGDCIYISLDGRGDDPAGKVQPLESDDAVFNFGLGDQGPECRASQHGNPVERTADQSKLLKSINRDETARTTIYDIAIPFEKVSTALGQSPTVGIAACIAHKDSDGKDLEWGKIRADARNPRKLNLFALPAPAKPFASIAPLRTRLTRQDAKAEATVALKIDDDATIEASLGRNKTTETVRPDKDIQRFTVRVPYDAVASDAAAIEIKVISPELKDAVHARYELSTPRVSMDRFGARVEKLLAAAPNDIARDHLKAVLLVVQDAYTRLPAEMKTRPESAEEFLNFVELIAGKMPTEKVDWNDHVRKCMPLVFTFVSQTDKTLQFYALQMPFDYQEGKSYPLTIYLHGAGSPNPLGGLSTAFDNSGQDTLFRTEQIDPADVPPSHRGFVLAPWARGNSMYRGPAEKDVWQSIDLVKKRFKIDPDRVYLTGFSMGCGGTMGIAGRRPDAFAGVNLASGFGSWSDTSLEHLAENLRGMPIAVWIGELDSMVKDAKAFHEMLDKKGIAHRFEIVPRLPHTYPYLEYQKSVGYLMQFTRKRPDKFSFIADNGEYTGRNGVFMTVEGRVQNSARPSLTCSVNKQEVSIESKNTSALSVDLAGPDGLGLSGDVKIIWNGREIYSGPAKKIEIKN
ncbi:MAG: dienelactone hydrolase family protein [Planctomycetes bacterium]|nr:dienelactone hydrolase family protein [Planctomycetota bacterium]